MRGEQAGRDERRLARGAGITLAVLAVPLSVMGGLSAGRPGVAGALIGLALVGLLFGGAALLLAETAVRRPQGGVGVLVAGAVVRLIVYIAVLDLLSSAAWVHAPSLALATAVGIAVTLGAELLLLARLPHLFFIDADAARPPATATRSEPL